MTSRAPTGFESDVIEQHARECIFFDHSAFMTSFTCLDELRSELKSLFSQRSIKVIM